MAGVALFGVIAYSSLSVRDLPQVDYPPRASKHHSPPAPHPTPPPPAAATPLERQFTTIAGLDSMISNSGQGSSNITLQFSLSRDRKSTRLNSSHLGISYAVFCLKK